MLIFKRKDLDGNELIVKIRAFVGLYSENANLRIFKYYNFIGVKIPIKVYGSAKTLSKINDWICDDYENWSDECVTDYLKSVKDKLYDNKAYDLINKGNSIK